MKKTKINLFKLSLLITLIFSYFTTQNQVFSQDIVVSEYFNASDPKDEWIELLVVKDNLNIIGYVVRDNVENELDLGNPNKWIGGVTFTNNPIWRNLRAGTVIVINSRGNVAVDADPKDGYLEIGAQNNTYFDIICFTCNELNWAFDALNIATNADLIQILGADQSTNIHTLGHMSQQPKSSGDFDDIFGPKLARFSVCPIGASNRVNPGDKLTKYSVSGGFDSGNSLTACSDKKITKGLANTPDNTQSDINQRFWRELREPIWATPKLSINLVGSDLKITWDKAQIDPVVSDGTQGYMIVKTKKQFADNPIHPEDGTIYKAGDPLGPGIVIDNIIGSNIMEYLDKSKTDCGEAFVFRMYAFRYNNGNTDNFVPTSGRGRSYNTAVGNYSEVEFTKDSPPNFTIFTRENTNNFCNLDTTVIICDIPENIRNQFKFVWYKDNNITNQSNVLGSNDSLIVRQSGKYRLDIESSTGCIVKSNDFNIFITKIPIIVLRNDKDNIILNKDTTIYLCKGSNYIFNSSGNGDKKEWKRDGIVVNPNVFTYTATENGTYRVIYSNQGICFDSSAAITLRFLEYDLDFDVSTLQMIIPSLDNFVEVQVTIKNNRPESISFDKSNLFITPASNYEIIDPVPHIIPGNGQKIITIRFTLSTDGKLNGLLTMIDPCKNKDEVVIEGQKIKAQTTYNLSADEIVFKPGLYCDNNSQDTTFKIFNIGNVPINLTKLNLNLPFTTQNLTFPTTIAVGDSTEFIINFNSNTINKYNENLVLEANTIVGPFTIELPLSGEVTEPKFEIEPKSITFPTLSDCELFRDTIINISNIGIVPIQFNSQFANKNLEFVNFPFELQAGEEREIRIRLRPQNTGNISFSTDFEASPCGTKLKIDVNGNKSGISYALAKDTVDFGVIVNCGSTNFNKNNNTLNIDIPSGLNVKVKDIIISGNFTTNLTVGQDLLAINTIDVTLLNLAEGDYSGKVTLILDPCDAELSFEIKAKLLDLNFAVIDTVRFVPVFQDQISSDTIVVENTNDFPVILKELKGLNTFFTLRADMVFPIILAPNTVDTIFVEYFNPVPGFDTLDISLVMEEPCDLNYNITLTAQSIRLPIPPGGILSGIYGQKTELPGTKIKYTIRLTGNNNYDIKQTELIKTEFYISYNGSLLIPKSIAKGSAITNDVNAEITFDEYNIGFTKITLDKTNSQLLSNGDWIEIEFLSLLGNAQTTNITLDSIIFNSGTTLTYIEEEKGVYNLVGECDINGDRKIELITNFKRLKLINGNLITDNNKNTIEFEVLSNEPTVINIYNIYGEIVEDLINKELKTGVQNLNLNLNKYSNGMYFIRMINGIRTETLKFIINN